MFGGTLWGGNPSVPHGVPIIPIWAGEFWGGVVREARDKALAKLGSRPDYFSFCGFWLLLLLAKFTTLLIMMASGEI